MRDQIQQLLASDGFHPQSLDGLLFYTVPSINEGVSLAKTILYAAVSTKTILYLSGGSTPKPLYEALAREEKLRPGVVGLIDERYGEPMHANSNEKMIAETGLLRYFSILDIPYYAMLRGVSIEDTARRYDELIRSLQTVFPRSIGILGIGDDGHTAGIAPNRQAFHNPMFEKENAFDIVSWFDDAAGKFGKRVTQTFLALSLLDIIIVLALGEKKRKALTQLFENGEESEVPARFYHRPEIAVKTLFITDQKV